MNNAKHPLDIFFFFTTTVGKTGSGMVTIFPHIVSHFLQTRRRLSNVRIKEPIFYGFDEFFRGIQFEVQYVHREIIRKTLK